MKEKLENILRTYIIEEKNRAKCMMELPNFKRKQKLKRILYIINE